MKNIYFLLKLLFSGTLSSLSMVGHARTYESFASIVEELTPSIVHIRTKQATMRDKNIDVYQFFSESEIPREGDLRSVGTGILIDSSGLILTSYKLIRDLTQLEVYFPGKNKSVHADILGADRRYDLAVLKITPPFKLPIVSFGESKNVSIGDQILSFGSPFGQLLISYGIIAGRGNLFAPEKGQDFFILDAHIHPGNFGGPVVDIRGRVIALISGHSRKNRALALPAQTVLKICEDLKKYGKVRRPFLGIIADNILQQEDISNNDDSGLTGIIVTNLVMESPAYASGLSIGDIIFSINGEKIRDLSELSQVLSTKKPKDAVQIEVYRRTKSKKYKLSTTLIEMPDSQDLPADENLF